MSGLGEERSQRKGSVTLSCRIDGTLYDLLQKDCKSKGISLNSLVNSMAKRYISWEKYAAEIGYIPLARETVRLIFDNLNENTIKTISVKVGKSVPKEMTLLMFNKVDFESIVSFMEITSSRYGMVQHNIKGSVHDLIVHHGVNEKFSLFLSEVGRVLGETHSFRYNVRSADAKVLSATLEQI
jgi:hypothetical protein